VFVAGGLPGERVEVEVVADHRTWLEGRLVTVRRRSPERQEAPCPHVSGGCGGCDWQHAAPEHQRRLRLAIVEDCLRRLAGLSGADVRLGPPLAAAGYRTTVRAAVGGGGRAGFRGTRSHHAVTVGSCLIAHPLVEEVLVEGRFPGATEVTIRAGARTGERLAVVSPTAAGAAVPAGVTLVGDDELRAGRRVHYHEQVGGQRFRISARSFFQCRPDGAEALAGLVGAALDGAEGPLLDAYCGVGLFGVLAGAGRQVVGVESNLSSVRDAAANYGPGHTVVRSKLERWRPRPVGAAVADPARAGLGRAAVERLTASGAGVIALVSCDPASLARDARLLAAGGYDLDHVTVLDLFGHTSHVETVSRLVRR
jgi:23S rRNA (uracil1939-C5)-methyltransferase